MSVRAARNGIPGRDGLRVLRVNLSTSRFCVDTLPATLLSAFIGGRGVGACLFSREVPPDIGPFDPDNRIIVMNGPLAGSLIPGSNKVNVTFKSPLTKTYSYALCGGHWGPELKLAGYDGLIIEGRAEAPVWLWIRDDAVEIRPAGHLWGKSTKETDLLVKKELRDDAVQVAAIGPAGEKLNRIACMTAGCHREFGRGGVGAVLGSKRLKAIALRGSRDIPFADVAAMKALSEKLCENLRNHPKARKRRDFGTPEMVEDVNRLGFWSTRNFTDGHFEEGYRLEGPRMKEAIVVGSASCFSCPVACGKRTVVRTKDTGEILLEGPEFETIGLLGANCGISDWESIVRATQICDEAGMDTMSAGACVSLVMECYERGLLSRKETGGLDLRFGNGAAAVELLRMMADRHGIGDVLAEGVQTAGERFGAPELAIHSKGMPFATYDPRACKGMALTYATSPKGAHHMVATTMGQEMTQGTCLETRGKGPLQRDHQISMAMVDSLGLCATMRVAISPDDQAEAFRVVTGLEMDAAGLRRAAERIINLERLYNIRLGFSRKDDTLPRRFLAEPMPSGPGAGHTVDLDAMLDEYYDVMGWDRDGIPTPEKRAELGLDDV